MPRFYLTPPSGYADSYYDVQFTAEFDQADLAKVAVINATTGEYLTIVAVTNGHIQGDKLAVAEKTNTIQGFINLFNNDKMNIKLNEYNQLEIKCLLMFPDKTEEYSTVFYNESKSLDAGIVPFNISINNEIVDIMKHEPLRLTMTASAEAKVELAIKEEDSIGQFFHFDIVTKNGLNRINVPSPLLFTELQAQGKGFKKFKLYYVKFEGINYSGFVNRKYIPIQGLSFCFNSDYMPVLNSSRQGPIGKLSQDFVLSHRYLVPTWKEFSNFHKEIDEEASAKMNRFLYEAIDMRTVPLEVASVSEDKAKTIRRELQLEGYRHIEVAVPRMETKPFLSGMLEATPLSYTSTIKSDLNLNAKKGGCGCSRKKLNV
jgi:hypothetical protein